MQVKTMIKRLNKLMPYRDIAEELGVAISTVCYWKKGEKIPRQHRQEAIRKLYDEYI